MFTEDDSDDYGNGGREPQDGEIILTGQPVHSLSVHNSLVPSSGRATPSQHKAPSIRTFDHGRIYFQLHDGYRDIEYL